MIAQEILARESEEIQISVSAAEQLLLRRWSGNIRELSHVILRATLGLKSSGSTRLGVEHLPEDRMPTAPQHCPVLNPPAVELPLSVDILRRALEQTAGNATRAANLLGVSRATLYNFCTRQNLTLSTLRDEPNTRDAISGS
jgi:transcriptional regulator of acetoin/glycerol metabolism